MSDREPSPRSGAPRMSVDDGRDPVDPSAVPDVDVAIAASTTSTAAAAAAAAAAHPPFEPLFTLLTNTTNNTTIHPRVHYLFSDDDPSILPGSAPLDPSHRALVLDLAPAPLALPMSSAGPGHQQQSAAGWHVSWAASLSPSFAVTESNISVVQQGHRDDGSIMLRIDGVEREPVHLPRNTSAAAAASPGVGGGSSDAAAASSSSPAASGHVGKEDVDALVDDFRRRMGVMAKVVGQGHKRREALDQQQEQDDYDDEDGLPQTFEDVPETRDYEEPISPTTQTHLQHDDSRWR